jgi:hypothetical protein
MFLYFQSNQHVACLWLRLRIAIYFPRVGCASLFSGLGPANNTLIDRLSQAGHRKFSAYNPQTGRSLAGSSPSARLRTSVSIVLDQVRRRGMGTTKRGRTGSGRGDRFRPKPQGSYARRSPDPLLGGGDAYQRGRIPESARIRAMLRPSIAGAKLSSLRPSVLAAYSDERLRSVSAPTIRREMGLLQSCFEVARREWGVLRAALPTLSASATCCAIAGRSPAIIAIPVWR